MPAKRVLPILQKPYISCMHDTKRVLIFDDDQDLLDIFRFLFEDSGWLVNTFQNCDHIVERTQELKPDLILMDNWIPTIGGIKATQVLKSHSTLSHIPVIYISANNDIKALSQVAGADAFLAKPFDFEELFKIVQSLVNKS